MSSNPIEWLKENKCQEKGCYNYSWAGYIYCVLHLHGFPERMDTEDIERLKKEESDDLMRELIEVEE